MGKEINIYWISTMHQKFSLHIVYFIWVVLVYILFYYIVLPLVSNHLATPKKPGRTQDRAFRGLYLYLIFVLAGHYLSLASDSPWGECLPFCWGYQLSDSFLPTSPMWLLNSQYYFKSHAFYNFPQSFNF